MVGYRVNFTSYICEFSGLHGGVAGDKTVSMNNRTPGVSRESSGLGMSRADYPFMKYHAP
jgi:hypothetical protein